MNLSSKENPIDYNSYSYLQKRWFSYWYQIKEVHACKDVKTILEIGPGNNIVSNILKNMGYDVKTADNDPIIPSDYTLDIRDISDTIKTQFDLIMCCQILEHIPFQDIPNVLRNLRKLSRKYLLITLPYTSIGTFKPYINIKLLPFLQPIRWIKFFDLFPKEHKLNRSGGHYWEIGKKDYPIRRIIHTLSESGWIIKKHEPIFENPYHYLFMCERKDDANT